MAFTRRRGPLLEPAARYRSRCVRPSSTFAGCHGAGVQARGPTYVVAEPSITSQRIVNPHTDRTSQQQPSLGKAIRELRQKRGASLKTLATDAGITLNMLSLIERGEGNPTWAT